VGCPTWRAACQYAEKIFTGIVTAAPQAIDVVVRKVRD
jgi:hypothetical protein